MHDIPVTYVNGQPSISDQDLIKHLPTKFDFVTPDQKSALLTKIINSSINVGAELEGCPHCMSFYFQRGELKHFVGCKEYCADQKWYSDDPDKFITKLYDSKEYKSRFNYTIKSVCNN